MSRIAITGALLIDGTGSGAQPETTVLWNDDRIVAVGPDRTIDLTEARVIEAGGGAVVPGLIDSHVHLCVEPTLDGIHTLATDSLATVAIRSAQSAKRLFDAGITTARDQGSRDGVAIEVAAAQRNGWLIAARILAAGRGITSVGGHGKEIGVEVDGPAAAREAVAAEIDRGADVIKLFPTGGLLGSGASGFDVTMPPEVVAAAVDEAHARGAVVGAHVHGPDGIDVALDAGVDTIEHGTAATGAQAARMADAGVALVPTLAATDALRGAELPGDLGEQVAAMVPQAHEAVRRCIAAGVTVLAGTDAGTPFNRHGDLLRELRLLAGLGLGNDGAIRAATSAAAATLRLDGLGIVAPGKRADLVLVAGDPLADLDALAEPRVVVQNGKTRVVT